MQGLKAHSIRCSKGFTLIELLISITLSLLIVMAGLQYYQWSIKLVKKQHKDVSEELTVRTMIHWLENDLNNAGWMGCRFWHDPILLETDVPMVSSIHQIVGLESVWQGLASDLTIAGYLDSKVYQAVASSKVIWIQKTVPWLEGHPLVPERCDRIVILADVTASSHLRSFTSVLWFVADHKNGHRGVYRKDLFGQTDEVLQNVFSMTLKDAVLTVRFSETDPIRTFTLQ